MDRAGKMIVIFGIGGSQSVMPSGRFRIMSLVAHDLGLVILLLGTSFDGEFQISLSDIACFANNGTDEVVEIAQQVGAEIAAGIEDAAFDLPHALRVLIALDLLES